MWICVNCWEVLLGHDSKMEHVGARHLLTKGLDLGREAFVRLAR